MEEQNNMITQPPSTAHKTDYEAYSDAPQQSLKPSIELDYECPVSSLAYLTDDSLAALGMDDGMINIIATNKGTTQYVLKSTDKSPVTSITLNPDRSSLKNAILVTHSQGSLEYWHATSRQLLFSKKYDEFLYASEISPDGTKYLFAGDKGHLLLSNMNKGTPVQMQQGQLGAHGNKVFCIKWSKHDQNVFFSGSWDKTVFFWDIRTKTAFNKIYGSYIGGKSLDCFENQLLIGSNSNQFPLKIYDIKAQKMRALPWPHYNQASVHSITGVLSCNFGYNDPKIVIAQTARQQIRIYNQENCQTLYQQKGNQSKGYALASAQSKKQIIASWNNGNVKIFSY